VEISKNIENFVAFIQSLTTSNRIAVVHDTDPDGMSAAVLLKKGLQRINRSATIFIPKHRGERSVPDEMLDEFTQHNIDTIIFLDIAAETYPDAQELDSYKVLVLDHHPSKEDIPPNFTIVKPDMLQDHLKNYQFCTADLVYTLFSEFVDMSDLDWIAAVGIIGDSCYIHRKDFVDKVLKQNNVPIKKNVFDTEFSNVTEFCSYADCVGTRHAHKVAFESLDYAANFKEAIEGLQEFLPVKNEIHKALDEFPKKKETHKNIIFYKFQSDYFINSVVSTILSFHHVPKNTTLFVCQEVGGFIKVSGRRQDLKVDMGMLMKKATEHFNDANGGGHIPAAGGTIRKEDFESFKKKVLQIHKEKK